MRTSGAPCSLIRRVTTVLNPANFRCQAHGKAAFVCKQDAEEQIRRAHGRAQTGKAIGRMPTRAYLGECGWWHLSGYHEREGVAA